MTTRSALALFAALFAGSIGEALAQQCLGRPIDAGEQAIAVRLDLDEFTILSGEYSRAETDVAWNVVVGAAADELIPPGDFAFALGGGGSWTGLHRAICPAAAFRTLAERDIRRTRVQVGAGLGRRLGEKRIRGAAFLFPHVRIVRDDLEIQGEEIDDTRHEVWLEGGFSLRGERLWAMAVLGLQIGNYLPGEDVLDGSLRFAAGVAF